MKKYFSLILVCLLCVSCIFAGCGEIADITLSGGPSESDVVLGNGGMVVRKGDYVYFTSAFESKANIGTTATNEKGKVTDGAIYRAKLVEGAFTDVQLMVSKLAGFEQGGLYIFGNNLYFASPCNDTDGSGKRLTEMLTFFKVDLNGNNLKSLYSTTKYPTGAKYTFTKVNDNVYILINTTTEIIKVDLNGNSSNIASEITSAALPTTPLGTENYLGSTDEFDKFAFFTTDRTKADKDKGLTGSVLNKVNIETGEITEIYKENAITINLLNVKSGRVYYTRNKTATGAKLYFSNDFAGAEFTTNEKQHSLGSGYTSFMPCGKYTEGDSLYQAGIVYTNSSKTFYRSFNSATETKQLLSSAATLLCVEKNYLYYVNSSKIYRIDLMAFVTTGTVTETLLSGSLTVKTEYYDLDSEYFYFYAQDASASSYYLHCVKLSNIDTPVKLLG